MAASISKEYREEYPMKENEIMDFCDKFILINPKLFLGLVKRPIIPEIKES